MKRAFILATVLCLVLSSCSPGGSVPEITGSAQGRNGLQLAGQHGQICFYCIDRDVPVIADLKRVLDESVPGLCRNLQLEKTFSFSVEVYPDQSAYDEHLWDKSVTGSPACSGDRRILLVSPVSPIKITGISYDGRLKMAVHEFAHLLVDEINDDAPTWLDEGIACYEGSYDFYIMASKQYMERLPPIDLMKLEDEYYSLPGADIYAFYAVSFILKEYGYGIMNKLLRSPEELEDILGITKTDFSSRCDSYMRDSG